MKKALFALLGAALFVCALVPIGRGSVASAAQPSPVPTYCAPPITIVAGHEAKAAEIQSDLQHAEQCSGQYGDIYTDGPLYNSTVGFSGSSLSVTFPKNIVVVLGQRVYIAQSSQTVPASATSYWFLDAATGAWASSLTNSPPTSTSELQYSVVATSSGVSSVTYGTALSSTPVYASLILSGSATASDLTATNQAGHSGFMATFNAGGQLIATATPTPASLLCPNAGTNITVTGTYPCTVNSTATGGVSSLVAGQNITLTPSGGTGNVTVADTVTPGPQATPSPTAGTCETVTGAWPYTQGPDLTCSPTWTGAHTWAPSANVVPVTVQPTPTAAPTQCPGATGAGTGSVPQGAICVGPFGGGTGAGSTGVGGIVIGKACPTSIWIDTTTCNSAPLTFIRNSGSGDGAASIWATSSGAIQMSGNTLTGNSWTAVTATGATANFSAVESRAGGSTSTYVPPVFTSAGAAVANTFHGAEFTCTFSAATTCTTAAWTGSAVFTAAADIEGCDIVDSKTTAPAQTYTFYNPTTTTISIFASASNSDTVRGVCWGF